MKKYKLDTGLAETYWRKFRSDKEAWEGLRYKFGRPKYAVLWRQESIEVPIVNRAQYVKKYNAKYTSQKIGKKNIMTYSIPVLEGITSNTFRSITEFFDFDGNLIAEYDPHKYSAEQVYNFLHGDLGMPPEEAYEKIRKYLIKP